MSYNCFMEYNFRHNLKPWETPELTGINRLPSRATLYPYLNVEDALLMDRSKSPFFDSLDGTWKFNLYEKPEAVANEVLEENFSDTNWGDIAVPGCWTRQDKGDQGMRRCLRWRWRSHRLSKIESVKLAISPSTYRLIR